jgi:hypothetical protein
MNASDLRRRWKRSVLLSLTWGGIGGVLAERGGWAGVLAVPILIVAGGLMYCAGELSAVARDAEQWAEQQEKPCERPAKRGE